MPEYTYFQDPDSGTYKKFDPEAATLLGEGKAPVVMHGVEKGRFRLWKTRLGNYVQQTATGDYCLLDPHDALESLDSAAIKLTEAGRQERARLLADLAVEA